MSDREALQTSWPAEPAGAPPPRHGRFEILKELPVLIVLAFAAALVIKTFLIQAFYIPSGSMIPSLLEEDRVLVNKLAYRFRDPRRGEIVVFVTGGQAEPKGLVRRFVDSLTEGLGVTVPKDKDFIKRVIGLPGETISIAKGVVTVAPEKGKPFVLKEPYLSPRKDTTPFGPYKVPQGRYFLMGDNRADSSDSRINDFSGLCPSAPCSVPKSRMVGKAFLRLWPAGRVRVFGPPVYGLVAAGMVFGAGGVGARYPRRRGAQWRDGVGTARGRIRPGRRCG